MEKKTILITGANGEVGHGLIQYFSKGESSKDSVASHSASENSAIQVVAVDLRDFESNNLPSNVSFIKGDILDPALLTQLRDSYNFDSIFHLAALLSTSGEKDPLRAHRVNVEGSLNMLELARAHSERNKSATKFLFPSTIAVYGLSRAEHSRVKKVSEDEFLSPITIYGTNKLYIEKLGAYYSSHFKSLQEVSETRIDFRAVRFPGLISSETTPTGGTSDYGAEILHAAVKKAEYDCFVEPGTTLPFMVMPDAIRALVQLSKANRASLKQAVYNLTSFSVAASEIASEVRKYFPGSVVNYKPHKTRLSIVESWPRDMDDSAARRDWGWAPEYNFGAAFEHYLVPGVLKQYGLSGNDRKQASCS